MVCIKFNLKEFEEDRKRNFEERLKFIEFWVNYMKSVPNEKWGAEQKKVVDGQKSRK